MEFRSDITVDGGLKDVWWVRARYGHTMPVRLSTHPYPFIFFSLCLSLRNRESTLPLDEYFMSLN